MHSSKPCPFKPFRIFSSAVGNRFCVVLLRHIKGLEFHLMDACSSYPARPMPDPKRSLQPSALVVSAGYTCLATRHLQTSFTPSPVENYHPRGFFNVPLRFVLVPQKTPASQGPHSTYPEAMIGEGVLHPELHRAFPVQERPWEEENMPPFGKLRCPVSLSGSVHQHWLLKACLGVEVDWPIQ